MDPLVVVAAVRTWLHGFVVELDLCPFAGGPLRAGRVRIAVSEATDLEEAVGELLLEAERLDEDDDVETSLLVLPDLFPDFEDFLDVTAAAEEVFRVSGYDGIYQIVVFHPGFRFEGSDPADPANGTNRSPFPMWHLLRESSVERAIEGHPDVASIPARNAELLRELAD
ncbi:MAG: DUF1415 domain-containing protein [Myxococcota bacterium]